MDLCGIGTKLGTSEHNTRWQPLRVEAVAVTQRSAAFRTTLKTAVALGRVSNLPTVWTNVVAAFVLSGAQLEPRAIVVGCLALSLFYTGGMYLNDAFDREIDARERPERPIPSGRVSARTVFIAGFAQLALGVTLVALMALLVHDASLHLALLPALGLAGLIVLYDMFHKHNPLSPLLMGLCRVGVYVTVALASVGHASSKVWIGALVLLAYLIGLTYVAKQERWARVRNWWPLIFLGAPFVHAVWVGSSEALPWGFVMLLFLVVLRSLMLLRARRIPNAVVTFIAGIALVDASLIALTGRYWWALGSVAAFAFTLTLQRWVRGT